MVKKDFSKNLGAFQNRAPRDIFLPWIAWVCFHLHREKKLLVHYVCLW